MKSKFSKLLNVLFYLAMASIIFIGVFKFFGNIDDAKKEVPDDRKELAFLEEVETEPAIPEISDFEALLNNIKVYSVSDYSTTIDNIRYPGMDDYILDYDKELDATVVSLYTVGGQNLSHYIRDAILYSDGTEIDCSFYSQKINNDNDVLILTTMNGNQLDKLGELSIKLSFMDEYDAYEKTYSVLPKNIEKQDVYHKGDIFEMGDGNYGFIRDNNDGFYQYNLKDLASNRFCYTFSGGVSFFSFGDNNKIDLENIKFNYDIPDGLDDFESIEYTIEKSNANTGAYEKYNEETYEQGDRTIKFKLKLPSDDYTDDELAAYKETLDKTTISINGIELSFK